MDFESIALTTRPQLPLRKANVDKLNLSFSSSLSCLQKKKYAGLECCIAQDDIDSFLKFFMETNKLPDFFQRRLLNIITATYASIGFAIPMKHWQSTSELTLINRNDPRSITINLHTTWRSITHFDAPVFYVLS